MWVSYASSSFSFLSPILNALVVVYRSPAAALGSLRCPPGSIEA
jgi:hypothetical protein